LVVAVEGRGRPVVLLHGLGASSQAWEPLVKALDLKKWRVIAPDLLGFGESPRPEWNQYTVKEQARAVRFALRRLKVKGQVTLVAHSMGCLVATQMAAVHPKLIKRLVLYQPPLFVDDPEYEAHVKRKGRYFKFFEYVATHPEFVFLQNTFFLRMLRKALGFHLTEEDWIPFSRSLRNVIMHQNTYEQLRHISMPTDIIHGRMDFVVIRTEVKNIFKNNRNIKFYMVNQKHDITPRAAKYLVDLLEGKAKPKKAARKKPSQT